MEDRNCTKTLTLLEQLDRYRKSQQIRYLAASSRLVDSRTTSGAAVIKSPTTLPLVLLSSFCI